MSVAVIIGANGAIGSALSDQIEEIGRYNRVLRLSRQPDADIQIDICGEESIQKAATQIAALDDELTLCLVATGMLHNHEFGPEKSLKAIDPDWMALNYRVNTIGPTLIAKYFLPLMSKRKPITFAAISARVGSISDNRLGGWYSYRASKAALNMVIRNLAIEYSRSNKEAIITALHPGTVDSGLSRPFQGSVAKEKLFDPIFSANQMLAVLAGLNAADSGKIFAWDGREIAP